MNIAVLSGKGGTGKTLVSVNLAAVAGQAAYIDCDVEEPNGHLFFKPDIHRKRDISVKIPVVDAARCTGCRICVDFCKFNALALIQKKPLVFHDVCHSCGGCVLLCPEKALSETDEVIGHIESGMSREVSVETGILNSGEASGIPIINQLLSDVKASPTALTFIDCPPGSACIVMESIKDADYCIVVAEPTIFGVHNLDMIVELVTVFQKPFGVVLNKCMPGENPAEAYCARHHIPILARIPFDAELGKLNADGRIAVWESNAYRGVFADLLNRVKKEVHHETALNS